MVHNVRSSHNVGSILRTADGLGAESVYLTGYTPYPKMDNDPRLPHLADKTDRRIKKTALGAETTVKWHYMKDVEAAISRLKKGGYQVAALEQTPNAMTLQEFTPAGDIALVCGSEVGGLPKEVIALCDIELAIPMFGAKESLNVSIAAAIALYHLRFKP